MCRTEGRTPKPRKVRNDAGISLAELLVVLLLIGLLATLTAPVARFSGDGLTVQKAAADVQEKMRAARSAALGTGQTRAVIFEPDARRAIGHDGSAIQLSGNLAMAVTGDAKQRVLDQAIRIQFRPDGSSSGGAVLLSDGRTSATVTADWLTGGIDIANR